MSWQDQSSFRTREGRQGKGRHDDFYEQLLRSEGYDTTTIDGLPEGHCIGGRVGELVIRAEGFDQRCQEGHGIGQENAARWRKGADEM